MQDVVVYGLYLWVAISVLVLAAQLMKRARQKGPSNQRSEPEPDNPPSARHTPEPEQAPSAPTIPAAPTVSTTPGVPSAPTVSAAPGVTAPSTSVIPVAPSVTVSPGVTVPAPPTVPAAASPTHADPAPSPTKSPPTKSVRMPSVVPDSLTEAEAAPPQSASPPASDPTPLPPPGRSLAQVLAGLQLPSNLLPAIDQTRPPSNQRVSLLTNTAPPSEVGGAVADELERLGFVLSVTADDQATASRGEDLLGLHIVPEAVTDFVEGKPRFPDAPENSVAVDIWLKS